MRTILYAFLFASLISCRQNAEDEDQNLAVTSINLPPPAPESDVYAGVDKNMDVSEEPEAAVRRISSQNAVQQKIIRSANLKFQCDDLKHTNDRIMASVKKFGGYLQNDREASEYSEISRTIQVRVPSKSFDAFLSEVSSGVRYFDEKNISSQDVTDDYIDNDSRIKTQKALENRYLELLKKANKVSEMIEIEQKLSEIRAEIESKQARLNYLQSQVDMSSFSITFYKIVPEKEGASVSFGSKIGNALKSGVNSVLDFFIWLLGIWPFIIILVALIVFFRKRWRRRQKN